MLTADLVRARKKGNELLVSELGVQLRPRALELARDLLGLAQAHVGATRAELEEAFAQIEVSAAEQKLAQGLRKLVEDRIAFDIETDQDPRALRSAVYEAAARERQALGDGEHLDREAFLARQAAAHGLDAPGLLRALYADLRNAQVVRGMKAALPEQLVDGYDLAQKQAVLLKAVQVVADVRCRDAYAYRLLFRKLKFFRLLHSIEPRKDGGYRIHIDGPFSLFAASTKYGLELALALPALLACDEYRISANLRWGKERVPLTFKIEGKAAHAARGEPPPLPDDVAAFLERFIALESDWSAEASSDILEVRGVGLCVPDVRFVHRETGEIAYLEVLGYWSREAVWKRVELSSQGLNERVLFAVSRRLRVSEEVLGEDVPSELYVYKGIIAPKEVLRRLSGADDAPK